jgi:CopG family nickel-responsive transcriptional regulator
VLTFIYAYDQPDLARRLLEVRHGHHAQVVSSTQVHIDRHDCLEVLILRGPVGRVRDLADRVLALHGVRQGQLTLMPARCPLAREHRPQEAVQ